jgi:hypothetical protein
MIRTMLLSGFTDSGFFMLVGSGLALAAVLTRHFLRHKPLPKPHQMVLWVAEVPEDDSLAGDFAVSGGDKIAGASALSQRVM